MAQTGLTRKEKREQRIQRRTLLAQALESQIHVVENATKGTDAEKDATELMTRWTDLKSRININKFESADVASDKAVTTKAAAKQAIDEADASGNTADVDAAGDTDDDIDEIKVDYVTRYEIREMSDALQKRFFDAVDKMMENKNGVAGTSDFFRCASYHGNPPPIYCKHGRETFPGWHRIYLLDFEKELQKADRALGNDGDIGLPYWDWTIRPEDGLPAIIRKRFNQWPKDLFPSDLTDLPSLLRNDDATIGNMIRDWGVIQTANDCLLSTQHMAHASTGGEWSSSYPSVEAPHNYMHVIVGGQGGVMGAVAWAAFDIAFWLHHCNVDRIYETYIQMEPDSKDEFEWGQKQNANNLYEEAFEPFRNADGKPYYPSDTFDIKKLGFIYNTPFPQPNLGELRLAPTVCVFPNVKVNEFESKCYQIHVYVINKADEANFNEPTNMRDIDTSAANYAGGAGVFGRGMECENCQSRLPYDIVVDLSKTLIRLKLSRYDAKLKVYCMETTDTSGNLIKVADTPLPEPSIVGPLFEDTQSSLKQDTKDTQNQEEVLALQRWLKRFGYYDDELDGKYGPNTETAVKVYQEATGSLETDGKAGPLTKKEMTSNRRCSNKDGFGKNEITDDMVSGRDNIYNGKKNISYNIGYIPGYLWRRAVQTCIRKAFDLWSEATGGAITFEELPALGDSAKADITFTWSTASMRDGNLMKFDGPGGVLGHGGLKEDGDKGFVVFDQSERWVIGMKTRWNKGEAAPSDVHDPSTWYRGQPTISLFYTATHEIGHALGLDHSIAANDFMSPFYNPNKKSLSANDIARIKAKFGVQ